MSALLLGLAAAAAGGLESVLLAQQARRGPGAWSLLGRWLLVGGVLLTAARQGALLEGGLGWLLGFALGAGLVYRRLA